VKVMSISLGNNGMHEWCYSYTPRSLYPREKSPGTHWLGRQDGPQSRSGRGGEEKKSQPLSVIEHLSSIYWLSYPCSWYQFKPNIMSKIIAMWGPSTYRIIPLGSSSFSYWSCS
jgi:hypothetical protein